MSCHPLTLNVDFNSPDAVFKMLHTAFNYNFILYRVSGIPVHCQESCFGDIVMGFENQLHCGRGVHLVCIAMQVAAVSRNP